MKQYFFIVLSLSTLANQFACASSKKNSEAKGREKDLAKAEGGITSAGDDVSLYPIQGTWTQPCEASDRISSNRVVVGGSPGINLTVNHFSDADCAHPSYSVAAVGTQLFAGAYIPAAALKINFTISQYLWTIFEASSVDASNQANFCGYSDWAVGVPKDVSGKTCDDQIFPDSGSTIYDIFRVEGYPEELHFGLLPSYSESSRPTTLSPSFLLR